MEESNYYPGGHEHKGYNGGMYGVKNNLKTYQGQEFTEDLGLNTHEWRYRISDPTTLRFWQVDPLAEDYTYNSVYAFQENKLGMGIELEGAEFLGWDVAQEIVTRGINFFGGAEKMISGNTNMINKSIASGGGTTELITSTSDGQGMKMNPHFEMTLDGAIQADEALPNKQDVRNTADAMELVGDTMVLTSPATGPGAPATAATGGIVGSIGFGVNLSMDLIEGDIESASIRLLIEGISFGMGSLVKQSGGDRAVEELTNTLVGGTGEVIQQKVLDDDKRE